MKEYFFITDSVLKLGEHSDEHQKQYFWIAFSHQSRWNKIAITPSVYERIINGQAYALVISVINPNRKLMITGISEL